MTLRRYGPVLRWLALAILPTGLGACDGCTSQARTGSPRGPEGPSPTPPSAAQQTAVSSPRPASGPSEARELVWDYAESSEGPMRVVVSVPAHKPGEPKFPVLIALHGRGEALKGPERGARGWIDDYAMPRALRRLDSPPLTRRDLQGFASEKRLAQLNSALAEHPYRGLVVVMPYTPESLAGGKPFSGFLGYGRFLVERILPRVARETPAIGTPQTTGIDGVSLGGRVGLLVGLQLPEAFGAVAGLQAAFDSADASEVAGLAVRARAKNPGLRLRLLTSDDDYFLRANRAISKALGSAGLRHHLVVVPGPHDYAFNRGPGVYEMLIYHDRVLRGLPPV